MATQLATQVATQVATQLATAGATVPDAAVPEAAVPEAAVRAQLRAQIARLEADLPPGRGHDSGKGARIQTIEELERTRDDLAHKTQERRFTNGEEQDRKRRLREEMLLDPNEQRGRTVRNEEVGEPGCSRWTAWFRLTVSGGCP